MRTVLVAICLSLPAAAAGQAGGAANAPASPTARAAPADPFAQMIAARSVADFARRHKDPQSMIVAARMLQEVPVQSGAAEPTGQGEPPPRFSPEGLFAEATTLAHGDPALLMQINTAQSGGTKGVFSSAFGHGLVRSVQNVGPRATYRFSLNAVGRQPLRIGAIGDLGTAMSMKLVDGAGHVVCADDRNDYAPVCVTTPSASASYRVELLNRSAAASRTVILSN